MEHLFDDAEEISTDPSTSGSSSNLNDGNDDWIMAAVQSTEMSLSSSDYSSQFDDEVDDILMEAVHQAEFQLLQIKPNDRSLKPKLSEFASESNSSFNFDEKDDEGS